MRYLLSLLLALSSLAYAKDDVYVPEGFILQPLVETDGQIARPKDWFFTSRGTQSGWLWTISKEDPAKGPYKTGMRIQLFFGVQKVTGKTREEFVNSLIEAKRATAKVLRDCPQTDFGDFVRKCLEVLEDVPIASGSERYRILYSGMSSKEMDMVVITTFGAPPDAWETVGSVADVMSKFRLIGPNLGKQEKVK
jgi:hypothetical protein